MCSVVAVSDDLLLPATIARELEIEGTFDRPPTCEAARTGTYSDSRRKYVRCGVTGDHYPIAEQPLAAAAFCFGDYTSCPIWMAHRDGALDAHNAKIARRATDRVTRRQIELGVRVNDRGVPEQG